MRLRIRLAHWPRPRLELTDTPQPDCSDCAGHGGFLTAAYPGAEEPDAVPCDCWDPSRRRPVLPVPRWIARRWFGYVEPVFSTEPPF